MSYKQHWPLSQDLNKRSGQCSVCFANRQIHLSDGLIHLHGPRSNPCSGSNKPPLPSAIVPSSSSVLQDDFLRLNIAAELPASILNTINVVKFQHPVVSTPLIKHIPRSARSSCGKLLIEILQKINSNTSNIKSWSVLLNFGIIILSKPLRSDSKQNLASIIKRRIQDFSYDTCMSTVIDTSTKKHKQIHSDENLAKLITSKIDDGNINAALRILLSDDKLAEDNDETYAKLLERHPPAPANRFIEDTAIPAEMCLQLNENDVLSAVRGFPTGSSGGPDGIRPQHIIDLLGCADVKPTLLTAITAFVNHLLQGHCPAEVVPYLFGGSLTALTKKTGGIRPIAVGYYWRRLTAKCANTFATQEIVKLF